jgi:hypothetical protein
VTRSDARGSTEDDMAAHVWTGQVMRLDGYPTGFKIASLSRLRRKHPFHFRFFFSFGAFLCFF